MGFYPCPRQELWPCPLLRYQGDGGVRAWKGLYPCPSHPLRSSCCPGREGCGQTLGAERITVIETPGGASNSAFRRRKHSPSHLDARPWAALSPRRLSPKAAHNLGGPHHVPKGGSSPRARHLPALSHEFLQSPRRGGSHISIIPMLKQASRGRLAQSHRG